MQVVLNGRLSVDETSVAKSRWSLKGALSRGSAGYEAA